MSPEGDLSTLIAGVLQHDSGALGVAVSGGSDSMALLHLLAGRPGLRAVTVDHGLRPAAAAEAAGVAAACAGLGVPHTTLHWRWDGTGNLSDKARQGRLRLIADWARAQGIGTVALGHTANDQAETFLMRLARGSGVDGLAGMAAERRAEGIVWVRPLLSVPRDDLRAFLTERGVRWFDDPTNADGDYQRVRARQSLEALAPVGVSVARLVDTSNTMAMARQVLEHTAQEAAVRIARIDAGDVVFDHAGLRALLPETRLRLLSHAVRWISSAIYRPRLDSVMQADAATGLNRRHTVGGCLLIPTLRTLRVVREWQAVKSVRTSPGDPWDQRWQIFGPVANGLEVGALGAQGLAQVPGWRAAGIPRSALLAGPAVWRGGDLVAAPLAGHGNGYQARLLQGEEQFFTSLLSH